MSILNQINSMSVEKAKAVKLTKIITDSHAALLEAFGQGIALVWTADDPQAVVDELGTNAAAVFSASEAAAICLESVSPGCTADFLTMRGTYTVNQDGTITDVVKPTP